jgi:hypothetical protein
MNDHSVRASPQTSENLSGYVFVASAIAVCLLIPPFVGVYKAGTAAMFRFFLQDTFYYLSVAANSTTGFYTFDGVTPTTGFHPLWQVYLTKLFEIAPRDQTFQIHLVFWASVAITALGYIIAGTAVYRMTNSKLLAVLMVPGFFNLLFSYVFRFAGSPWSFMNGMESPLTVLFAGVLFALISLHYSDPRTYGARRSFHFVLGIVLSLVVLSRLDDVFFVAAFSLCVLIGSGRSKRVGVVNAAILALPTAVLLCVYLGFNFYHTHMFLPVSGVMKGGIALGDNLVTLFNVALLRGVGVHVAPVAHLSHLYRQIQMLFPALVSLFFIFVLVGGVAKNFKKEVFLVSLLVGVCVKALYNIVNVHTGYQGVIWYFVLPMLVINFVALVLLSEPYRRFCEFGKSVQSLGLIVVVFFLACHLNIITMVTIGGKTLEYKFWRSRHAIAAKLHKIDPHIKLLEYEDGIINYALRIPAIHGIGFVVDRGAYEARQRSRMLDYGLSLGYDTIASLVYVRLPSMNMTSDQILNVLKRSTYFRGENLQDFIFEVLYVHKKTGATFIRFRKKS